MPTRFLLTTLQPNADVEAYERWVREYDYKVARSRENMLQYDVYRILKPIDGLSSANWSYLEHIELRDLERAKVDAQSESGIELRRQMGQFIDRTKHVTLLADLIK